MQKEKYKDKPYVNVPETVGFPPKKEETKKWIFKIADRIIDHTCYLFEHVKTGETFTNSIDLPVSKVMVLKSGFNDWKYWNGVIHMAFIEIYKEFAVAKYRDYVIKNYEFAFENLSYFKRLYETAVENANFHQFFRLDRLDDFGAMASGLIDIFPYLKTSEYEAYIQQVADYILNGQDRLEDGTFCRNRFGKTSLWGDDLYMSVPFLSRMWELSGDNKYLDDAILQVNNFHKHLYCPENGLMYHSKIMQAGHCGVAHWGRANGWMVMGQVELLKRMPKDHPQRQGLIDLLLKQLVGISRYQSGNGMWRQLLDKTDSYLETSCTAMIIRGVAAAVNEGWIDDIYTSIATNGWKGLLEHIKEDGEVDNVSTGFNIKQDLAYYYNRPIEKGGDHGLGAVLSAGIEIYRLKEYRDCVWC